MVGQQGRRNLGKREKVRNVRISRKNCPRRCLLCGHWLVLTIPPFKLNFVSMILLLEGGGQKLFSAG